uniref:Bm1490 n=1 Tax=Brugia malayi TaxID=6279 RepID=A0A1I9G4M0_BRUMA|nr:Bm1490 [Brugia malayi]
MVNPSFCFPIFLLCGIARDDEFAVLMRCSGISWCLCDISKLRFFIVEWRVYCYNGRIGLTTEYETWGSWGMEDMY